MNKSQRSSAPTDPSNQHAPPSHILGWCTAGAFSVFHQYWLYFMIWSTKLWHLNPSWATTISTKLIVKPKRWNHLFFYTSHARCYLSFVFNSSFRWLESWLFYWSSFRLFRDSLMLPSDASISFMHSFQSFEIIFVFWHYDVYHPSFWARKSIDAHISYEPITIFHQ